MQFKSQSDCYATDWSPDGTTICYTEVDSTGLVSIGLFSLGSDGGPQKFRENSFNQSQATFSPDGRWLAYQSNETGATEVFVESIAADGGRWRVSSEGGLFPIWSATGNRLYFKNPGGEILAAEITISDDVIRFGRTTAIVQGLEVGNYPGYSEDRNNGSLLVLKTSLSRGNSTLSLITGWQGLLENNHRN